MKVDVEQMWEQVKRAMTGSEREVYGSLMGRGKEPNKAIKAEVERKEAAWKENCKRKVGLQKTDECRLTKKKGERLKGVYISPQRM